MSHSSFIHWGGLKIYDKDKVKGEIFLYSWIISLFSYSCIAAWCRAESYQMLSRQFSLISHFQILTHFSFSRFHSRLRKLWFLALKPFPYLGKWDFSKFFNWQNLALMLRWRCSPTANQTLCCGWRTLKWWSKSLFFVWQTKRKPLKMVQFTIIDERRISLCTIIVKIWQNLLNISYQKSIK